MKKKLIKNLLLMLTMVVLCFAVCVTASAETWGDFSYEVLEDGTIEITNYSGSDTDVVIPSEIDGKIVTSIGERAFEMDIEITSIKLPENLRNIGEHAMFFCFSLKNLELSEDNQYFTLDEYGVLYNKDKTKLVYYPAAIKNKTYTIPDSVTVIGNGAFSGNTTLEEIIIPEGVTEIEDSNFDLCIALRNIVFPSTIKDISIYLDNPMFALQTITIPNGVETIDEWYIAYTAMLTDVYVESMDVEFIENEEYDMLGIAIPKEDQEKYFEFINSTFWEQDYNFSDTFLEGPYGYTSSDLGNQWNSFFEGEFLTKATTIHCHPGSTAEAYAINNSHGVNYVLTHFYEGEWQYDYDNCVKYRKCIHCNELETEEFIPETPAEPDAPTDEEVKEPLYVQLIDLIKMFFALIASFFKK